MSRARSNSNNNINTSNPHTVSLKVLRLSRPVLATQTPLPRTQFGHGLDIDHKASYAFPSADELSSSPLTPALTLPASFGSAHVGERFACTLCANNELETGSSISVSAVKVTAELQTPSIQTGVKLDLTTLQDDQDGSFDLDHGQTLQMNLQHELKEAGTHVLAVTITYTETARGEQGDASGGRVRSFKKLYQFVAQNLVSIRSKINERKVEDIHRAWVVEAQLENVGDTTVVLDTITMQGLDSLQCTPLLCTQSVAVKPQDIQQVIFLVKLVSSTILSKPRLGQITLTWRGTMGEPGRLTTGWLTSKT